MGYDMVLIVIAWVRVGLTASGWLVRASTLRSVLLEGSLQRVSSDIESKMHWAGNLRSGTIDLDSLR